MVGRPETDRNELRQSERRLFDLVTASSDVIYRMSADWSQMHQLKLSLDGKQFIAETKKTNPDWLDSYIYKADQPEVLAVINEAIRTKSLFELEHRVVKVDGSMGWTLSRALPLLDSNGEIVEWFGMAADITERKIAETRNLENEDQLRQVMEATTDGVFILDRNWNFTYVNSQAKTLLAPSSDLIGQSFWEAYPQNDVPGSTFYENYHRTMDEGTPCDFTGYYAEPYNTWFQVIVRPSVSGIIVFFRDVTASRKATDALIENEKLATMGRLVASIAHEVNNPLEAVTNLIYLARTSDNPATAGDYLVTADQELSRAASITSQTLRFYRHSTNPTEIDGKDLVDGVLTIHKGRIESFRVKVETRLRARRPVFCFDGEIRQVLSNLVGNATDAMRNQEATRRLLIRTRDGLDWRSGRRGLIFTIADTGLGMSQLTLKKAFEAFYTTKGMGGTGLGLWVSREIVVKHRGELRLRSSQAVGHSGTVFTLFLPYDAVQRASG